MENIGRFVIIFKITTFSYYNLDMRSYFKLHYIK